MVNSLRLSLLSEAKEAFNPSVPKTIRPKIRFRLALWSFNRGAVIEKILTHLGLDSKVPEPHSPRASPEEDDFEFSWVFFYESFWRGINLPCHGFPYSKIHFSGQTRLGVINFQSKSHSNDHKIGFTKQKDQKKHEKQDETSLNFVKNVFYSSYTQLCHFIYIRLYSSILSIGVVAHISH